MFSGHWMESELPVIQIDIPDANITTDGIVFINGNCAIIIIIIIPGSTGYCFLVSLQRFCSFE